MTAVLAEDVAWDLTGLTGTADPEPALAMLDGAVLDAGGLQGARGTIGGLDAEALADLLRRAERIIEIVERATGRAHLEYSTDVADPKRGALMAAAQEKATAVMTQMIFIELEWAALDDVTADARIAHPALAFCAHHLRTLRQARPHLLSEPEERILAEKSISGASAWMRLFDEQLADVTAAVAGEEKPIGLEAALSRTSSPDRTERAAIASAITAGLEPGLRTRAYIYNTLLSDKTVDDRLRTYDTWVSGRNLANQASDESVKALVDAVTERNDIPQRWYRLKAKLLGLDKLAFYDRNAALAVEGGDPTIAWADARDTVLDAYRSFSPAMADGAQRFFDERWIDAPIRPAKQGGAFCSPAVPSDHPYVLVNYTGKRRDVLTLAHELGHGVHFLMAGKQSIYEYGMPLTVAETASVFGETLTFNRLLENETDARRRLALLAENLEGQIATVFRQVAMWRFEDACHRTRRNDGELSVAMFNELWLRTQGELFGATVDTTGYENWWSYVHHFIHVPGYVYAYAFGQLLALSVYERSLAGGAAFVPSYLAMLSAGGSRSPEALAGMVGCDLADTGFWAAGLSLIDRTLAEAEEAAAVVASLP